MAFEEQSQREALILLLLAARYEDKNLSLSESDALRKQVESLGWDSGTSLDIFMNDATSRVRDALSTSESKRVLLQEACAHFASDADQRAALAAVQSVTRSDGESATEDNLVGILRGHWGL